MENFLSPSQQVDKEGVIFASDLFKGKRLEKSSRLSSANKRPERSLLLSMLSRVAHRSPEWRKLKGSEVSLFLIRSVGEAEDISSERDF